MSFPSHWHWQSLVQYAVPHCSGRHYTTRRGEVQLKSLVSAISVESVLQGIQYSTLLLSQAYACGVRGIGANPFTSNTGTFDLCLQKPCRYCMYSTRMPADPQAPTGYISGYMYPSALVCSSHFAVGTTFCETSRADCLLLHARMADGNSVLTVHHGFGTTTPVDQRPWLWTIGLLSLVHSALALCARVTSKWGLLWYDDAILAASYVSHSRCVDDQV
jgi:hypothetical protein